MTTSDFWVVDSSVFSCAWVKVAGIVFDWVL